MNLYQYRYFGLFRLLLAALVMVQHFAATLAPEGLMTALRPFEPGTLAVFAFFCLSGFVISESADQAYAQRPKAFLVNRFLRIFPHFLIAVMASFIVQYALFEFDMLRIDREDSPLPGGAFALGNLIANVTMLFPLYALDRPYAFVPIAWAVRVEMLYYLAVFAILAVATLPRVRNTYSFAQLAGILTVLVTPVFVLSVLHKGPTTPGYLPYFVFGSSLYFVQAGVRHARVYVVAAIVGMLLHFFSLPANHPTYGFSRNVAAQFVMLASLVCVMSVLARVRSTKYQAPDAAVGAYTYPLYLYHFVVLIAVASLLRPNSVVTFLVGIALSFLFSYGIARIIDPAIDSLRNRIRGWALT